MNRFSYIATNQQSEIVKGEIDAESVSQAVSQLDQIGLFIQSIESMPIERVEADAKVADFHRNIEELLASRPDWMPALEALAKEIPSPSVRRKLQKMLVPLQKCQSVKEFLASRNCLILLPLCSGGFQTDSDAQRLQDWLSSLLHSLQLQMRRRQVLVYPMFLAVLSIVVFLVLSFFVVPQLESYYGELNFLGQPQKIPFLFWLAGPTPFHALRTVISLLAIGVMTYIAKRLWSRYALTNRLLSTFVAGSSSNLAAMSVLIGTLAELLALKAPLSLALTIAGKTSRHYYFSQATAQLAGLLQSEMKDLASVPKGSIGLRRLPPTLMYALTLATGNEPPIPLLRELSLVYSDRLRRRTDWFLASVPMLAMLLIGIVTIFLAISSISQLFQFVSIQFIQSVSN